MLSLRHWSIRARLLMLLGVVLVALGAIGAASIVGQRHATQVNADLLANEVEATVRLDRLRLRMANLRLHEKDMIVQYENAVEVAKSKQAWVEALEQIRSDAKSLDEVIGDTAHRRALQEAMKRLDTFQAAFLPVARQIESMGYDSARVAAAFMGKVQGDYDAAHDALEVIAAELRASALGATKRSQRTATTMMVLVAAVIGAALLVLLPLTLLNLRSITRPIGAARALALRIAGGDLGDDAEGESLTHGRDETAELLRALAQMRTALREAIGEVQSSSDDIGRACDEIAGGNTDLSQRTERASSHLQQAASSMEQLTGTVRQSADSAAQANQLAASAAEVAARGGSVVAQVVSTMGEISASSKRIADIIGVIDGIAFQTNILALNAAVEAARAGEQGRGFAVVASEVRSLAQRSAQAAREIKTLIGSSVDNVVSGSKLVGDAGSTMAEIVNSVQRVSDIIGEITAAASEQSQGIGAVNSAVSELDEMTQANAALVQQSAAAAESLQSQAGRLARVVAAFRFEQAVASEKVGSGR